MEPLAPQHRLQRSPSPQNDDVTDFPDDASLSTTADLEEQLEHVRAEVQLVDGMHLPSSNGHLQTLHPDVVEGSKQTHVVVASRQSVPSVPVVVVAPHHPSPFAASSLQTRSSSFASD